MHELLNDIAVALNAHKSGRYFVAKCPLCNHDKSTLNIWIADDGKIGIRCYYSILGRCHSIAHIFYLQSLGVNVALDDLTGSRQNPSDTWNQIWNGAGPIMDSYADEYLFRRGIDIRNLPLAFLDSIRCVNHLKHPSGPRLPSLISLLTHASTNNHLAIHRTFLNPLGTDKFNGDPNKMTLGPTKGGVVKFGGVEDGSIAIGEGIETCLSAYLLHGWNVWATTSVGGLLQLEFPPEVKQVILLQDRDDAGSHAAYLAQERYFQLKVYPHLPSQGYKDFNDELRGY